jgi:hypothetical protein
MPRRQPFRTLDSSNNPSHPFACESLGGELDFVAANGLNGSNRQPLELQMKNSTAIRPVECTKRLSTWHCFLDRSIIPSKPIARESVGNEFNFSAVNGLNGLDGTVVNLRSVATAPNGIMDTVDVCTKGLRLV